MLEVSGEARPRSDRGLAVRWTLGDGSTLSLDVNLGGMPLDGQPAGDPLAGQVLFEHGDLAADSWAIRVGMAETS